MINERLYKRVRKWSSGFLLLVGVLTLLGIGYVRLNGQFTTSESHLSRRSADSAVIEPSIIHIETGYIIDNSNKQEKLFFQGEKETKQFVKYQFPSEKFVPLDELVTVLLNGMRFYHQGEQLLPQNKSETGPLRADTRSNDHLRCEGRNDFKAYRREHAQPTQSNQIQNDVQPAPAVDSAPEVAETAPAAPAPVAPVDETPAAVPVEAGKSDNPDTSGSDDQPVSTNFDDSSARSVQDLAFLEQVMSMFDDESTTSPNDATSFSDDAAAPLQTAVATDAPAPAQKNHRIGCCNGVPYNQNKRCCCRRIAFDKDKKFCCAINGCENFKVFDRANPKNIDLCLSLQGLVVQEYGYTGAHAAIGEPDLTRTPRARPRE